jgi:hypothetical protein
LEEFEAIRMLGATELDRALEAYISVANERGVQGLESTIVVAIAELGARGHEERRSAKRHLSALANSYRADESIVHLNAHAPIVRPGNPVVHFLPATVVHDMLGGQIETLTVDPDGALEEDLCGEEAIEAFERRWGADKAELLREICEGNFTGATGGGTGPGATAGLSVLDCLMDHEPTRAERLAGLMRACLDSRDEGDPLADRPAGYDDLGRRKVFRTEVSDDTPSEGQTTHYGYDKNDVPVYKAITDVDGDVEVQYYNEQGESFVKFHYEGLDAIVVSGQEVAAGGDPAQWDRAEAYVGGQLVESVEIHEDGSYTVTRYDDDGNIVEQQTYDENNEPVEPDDTNGTDTDAEESGFEGWGRSPECRAFNLALIDDRVEGDLEAGGIISRAIVNPDPEDPGTYEAPRDLACLDMQGDELVDRSLKCRQTISCARDYLVDENCSCQMNAGWRPQLSCKTFVLCADGSAPVHREGQCVCDTGEAIFEDPFVGGGPAPDWSGGRPDR